MSGYAVTENRLAKAQKIEAVLQEHLNRKTSGLQILDIGSGVGEIALFFTGQNNVFAVDVENQMTDIVKSSNIVFKKVDSEHLPFVDDTFDIIISNHVIEHVGDATLHLAEVKRCLKPTGICYFSTPNRIFPKEVHTKLWFLHWLPTALFFLVLKVTKRFSEPIHLLSYRKQKQLFKKVGLTFTEYTREIINNPDKYCLDERIPFRIPKWAQALSKTTIFVLSR